MTLPSEYYENRREKLTGKQLVTAIIVSASYVALMVCFVVWLG